MFIVSPEITWILTANANIIRDGVSIEGRRIDNFVFSEKEIPTGGEYCIGVSLVMKFWLPDSSILYILTILIHLLIKVV